MHLNSVSVLILLIPIIIAYVPATGSSDDDWEIAAQAYRDRLAGAAEKLPQIESIKYNTTVFIGQTAYLACIVKNLGDKTVIWIRKSDLNILTFSTFVFTSDPRISILREGKLQNSWILKIARVQLKDIGVYECQVNTEPVKVTLQLYLNVIDPAEHFHQETVPEEARELPLLQLDSTNSDRKLRDGNEAKIFGGNVQILEEGKTLNLTCIIHHSIPVLNISWFFNDIPIDPAGVVQVQENDEKSSKILTNLPKSWTDILSQNKNNPLRISNPSDSRRFQISTEQNQFSTISSLVLPSVDASKDIGRYTCGGRLVYPDSVILKITKSNKNARHEPGLSLSPGSLSIVNSNDDLSRSTGSKCTAGFYTNLLSRNEKNKERVQLSLVMVLYSIVFFSLF